MSAIIRCCCLNGLTYLETLQNELWSIRVFKGDRIVSFGFARTKEKARANALILLKYDGFVV